MKFFQNDGLWLKGNLHCHSNLSDGRLSPEQVKVCYAQMGYDFLAITDHRIFGAQDCYEDMLVLPGIELDTMVGAQAYHVVGVGMSEPCGYPREQPVTAQRMIDTILEAGGLAILAHPAWSLLRVNEIEKLQGLTASEVSNSITGLPNSGDRDNSSVILDTVSAGGMLLPMVASDDSHVYETEQGQNYIWVQAREKTQEAILTALREGCFFASQGPRFEQIVFKNGVMTVHCSPCERAVFYSNAFCSPQRTQKQSGGVCFEYKAIPGETFLRCEIEDARGHKAWSSPIAL